MKLLGRPFAESAVEDRARHLRGLGNAHRWLSLRPHGGRIPPFTGGCSKDFFVTVAQLWETPFRQPVAEAGSLRFRGTT